MDLEAAFDALPGLTERAAQRRMAAAVAEALEAEVPLLVHAPTGVGKSLGYLVPIVAAGRRAIVATATKALQSQLVERDLPRLAAGRTARGSGAAPSSSAASPSGPGSRPATSTWS
jgi:ATP-dependent DNA helicase DinG